MDEKKDFVIDIVRETTYQNQSNDYIEAFSKWRADENNQYGYKFVHDTREHTYMDGEGYIQKKADVAERISLYKCLNLLGICMLIVVGLDAVKSWCMFMFMQDSTADAVHFSTRDIPKQDFNYSMIAMQAVFALLRLIIPAALFRLVTRIPTSVAVPKSKGDSRFVGSGIILFLMLMVVGRIGCYSSYRFFDLFGIDSVYSHDIYTQNIGVDLIFVAVNCFVVPIVTEMLFRGLILQTLRQFGDVFAMVVSSIVYALTFYDVSMIGYGCVCGFLLAFFTIRTGSLKTAISMQVIGSCVSYFLLAITISVGNGGLLIEVVICTLILAAAIIVFSRLLNNPKWTFNISSDFTQLTLSKKMKIFATTFSVVIWIAAVAVMIIVLTRFV